jgi:hypothetical protein
MAGPDWHEIFSYILGLMASYAFYDCVDAYLQANPTKSLPHAGTEATWGTQATFPVEDGLIYKMVAQPN